MLNGDNSAGLPLSMHARPLQYSIAQEGIRGQVRGLSCGVFVLQFLPQDRVQSFAQMTPKQLLEESERALADGKYYDVHQDLVKDSQLLENSQHVSPLVAEHPKNSCHQPLHTANQRCTPLWGVHGVQSAESQLC